MGRYIREATGEEAEVHAAHQRHRARLAARYHAEPVVIEGPLSPRTVEDWERHEAAKKRAER
jgi:hypothetical protein